MSLLLETLANWRSFSAIVVGDFMLDELTFGHADRLSPEAPVPVLHVQKSEHRPGGAANVCLDLLAINAQVHALGVVGDDRQADLLRSSLTAFGVNADALISDPSRPTTVKQSLIGLAQHRHAQKMFRLDFESREPINTATQQQLFDRFLSLLPSADIVLIEDYNKGVCTPPLCQNIIRACRERNIEVLVDPAAIKDYSKYRSATTITPNRSEAALAAGISIPHNASALDHESIALKLQREINLDSVVITLDRDGALLLSPENPTTRNTNYIAQHVPTVAQQVYDVTGAGDMVLAALAGARANKLPWFEAVELANIAAGLEVQVFGVVPIPLARIHQQALALAHTHKHSSKVRTLEQVVVEAAAARHEGKTIIFTNGCFDILHAGHLSLLRRAAEQTNPSASKPTTLNTTTPATSFSGSAPGFLIVAVNSDDSVRRLKGKKDPARPINNEHDRSELLSGLECVDAVLIFDDDTPERVIQAIRPDVLVKGDEYSIDQVPGAKFVQQSGGRVVLLPMIDGKSTTGIVSKMRTPL